MFQNYLSGKRTCNGQLTYFYQTNDEENWEVFRSMSGACKWLVVRSWGLVIYGFVLN